MMKFWECWLTCWTPLESCFDLILCYSRVSWRHFYKDLLFYISALLCSDSHRRWTSGRSQNNDVGKRERKGKGEKPAFIKKKCVLMSRLLQFATGVPPNGTLWEPIRNTLGPVPLRDRKAEAFIYHSHPL